MGQIFVTPVLSYAVEVTQEEVETSKIENEQTSNSQNNSSVNKEKLNNNTELVDDNMKANIEDQSILSDSTKTIVDSGENGSCSWTLDENGILEIGTGTLGPSGENGPWQESVRSQTKKVVFLGSVIADESSLWALFVGFTELVEIEGLTNLNTSQVTVMDFLFAGASKLESLDLSEFDTSAIPKDQYGVWQVFYMCESLKSIKLGSKSIFSTTSYAGPELPEIASDSQYTGRWIGLNTGKVYSSSDALMQEYDGTYPDTYVWEERTMWGTSPVSFEPSTGVLTVGAGTIINYQGQKFDDNGKIPVSSVKEIIFQDGVVFPADSSQLFQNCESLEKVSGPVDTTNVTDMSSLFYGTGLTTVDVSSWDVSKVTDMAGMFGYSKIRELDVSNWDTRNVTDMGIWTRQTGLKEIKLGENFRFAQGNYGEYIPVDQPETDPEFDQDIYSGGWKKTDPIEPRSVYKDSYDFYENYDGSMPGTYTWQEWEWSLEVKDSILYVGDSWEAKDNFVSATDKYGDPLELVGSYPIDFEGSVDTDTPGVYEVTYMHKAKDEYDPWKKTAKVTVKENKTTLKVKDTTLYVGDSWTLADNFISATDKDGNALTVDDLEVEGTVDTKTAGVYEITYKNGSLSEIAKVTVKENKATLKVKDSTLYVGDKWASTDNFVSATDKEGNVLAVGDLEIEGTVDTSKAGVYEITYKNGSLSETAKVTVKENKATLKVKDSTLYVGDTWVSKDNFVSATDKEGNVLAVGDLEIEGTVDTSKAGIYEVTYKNGNLSKMAKVTVKEKPSISTSNGDQDGKQSQDNGSKNKQGTNNTNNSLPKAGEQSTFYLSVMGILLLLSGLVMMYRRTKIKN